MNLITKGKIRTLHQNDLVITQALVAKFPIEKQKKYTRLMNKLEEKINGKKAK
jgi:hypothetical protein